MSERVWKVYLSGEIHSDWRERIANGVRDAGLPVRLDAPVCVHDDSDDCGVTILGAETNSFWHDHKGAQMNAIRTRTLIADADIVVVRFGDKYRQWNAAFDAGNAAALGKLVKKEDWNTFRIEAKDFHLTHYINGEKMTVLIDNDEKARRAEGLLALQLHAGPPMTVQFRNIRVKHLK